MHPGRSFTKLIAILLAVIASTSIALMGIAWIGFEQRRAYLEINKLSATYMLEEKRVISKETHAIYNFLENESKKLESEKIENIKARVEEVHHLVENLYAGYQHDISKEKFKLLLLEVLKTLRFDSNLGYYFVVTSDGEEILSKNVNFLASTDEAKNDLYLQSIINDAKAILSGFFKYSQQQIGSSQEQALPNISYIKYFQEKDWIIGYGEYLDQLEANIQKELLSHLNHALVDSQHSIVVVNIQGDILNYFTEDIAGKNAFKDKIPIADQKIVAKIIKTAKKNPQGFFEYTSYNEKTKEEDLNIAYFRTLPRWGWIISISIHLEDLEKSLLTKQELLSKEFHNQIKQIGFIALSIFALIILILRIVTPKLQKSFNAFFTFFEKAATKSTLINPSEQNYKEFYQLALAANKMIAERNKAEEMHLESQLRFKTIFDVSPQIIVICDTKGILLEANAELSKLTNIAPKDAIGKHIDTLIELQDNKYKRIRDDILSSGSISWLEVNHHSKTGKNMTFLVFGKKLTFPDGDTVALIIFTDITQLKVAEAEKLILQERLSRSKQMEAMGMMAAEVAHDLNNILSGIIGYPQLLLLDGENFTAKQRQAITDILKSGEKAAAVVSDLLTITRGVAVIKEPLDLNKIINNYLKSPEIKKLKSLYPKTKIISNLEKGNYFIDGSQVHLTKIIMNLITNAYEAFPIDQLDPQITISTKKTNDSLTKKSSHEIKEQNYILLEIKDNGSGIPAAELNKIFDPFHSKKAKGRSGTGLGLAIVQNTVLNHGGEIKVSSSTKGTNFQVLFPLTQKTPLIKQETEKLENYFGQKQKVLIVDDLDIQRSLASKMLQTLNYTPLTASSGQEAIDFLKSNDVDLVILDMMMPPGLNGRETYEIIIKIKPQQKAIIASGMAENEEVNKAMELGVKYFVGKPYTIMELAKALKQVIT